MGRHGAGSIALRACRGARTALAVAEQSVASSFMRRAGTIPEQVAAILFLASDEASYVTGTVLPVAGGDLG